MVCEGLPQLHLASSATPVLPGFFGSSILGEIANPTHFGRHQRRNSISSPWIAAVAGAAGDLWCRVSGVSCRAKPGMQFRATIRVRGWISLTEALACRRPGVALAVLGSIPRRSMELHSVRCRCVSRALLASPGGALWLCLPLARPGLAGRWSSGGVFGVEGVG